MKESKVMIKLNYSLATTCSKIIKEAYILKHRLKFGINHLLNFRHAIFTVAVCTAGLRRFSVFHRPHNPVCITKVSCHGTGG
jgi:hypothetical protein